MQHAMLKIYCFYVKNFYLNSAALFITYHDAENAICLFPAIFLLTLIKIADNAQLIEQKEKQK